MKMTKYLTLAVLAIFTACTSQRYYPNDYYTTEDSEPVEEVKETPKPAEEEKIVMKEENVSVAEGESESLSSYRYYVILGSFSVYENAQTFKRQLMKEEFYPGILVNENGYYRVCIDSYNDESEARHRVGDIRSSYDKYNDVWLLIKKEN